jgi:opacity protein-like surface antigen
MHFKFRPPISAVVLSFAAIIGIESSAIAGGIEQAPATTSGFYITAGIGGAGMQAANSAANISGALGSVQFLPKNSFNFAWNAGVGYQIDSLFRVDVMYVNLNLPLFGYFTNTAVAGNTLINAFGASNMGFVDGYIDVMSLFSQPNDEGVFHPYFGGGVGFSYNDMSNITITNFSPGGVSGISTNTNVNFAWRVMAGLNFPITTHFQAFTQYSYISAGQYTWGNLLKGITTPGTSSISATPSFNIYSNMLGVGLTYIF